MKSYNNLSRKPLLAISFVLCSSFAICQGTEGWHKAGSHPDDYKMKIVSDVKHNGNGSVIISALKDDVDGFGTYMQTFKADYYHGKRLQLTAWIKTEDVSSAQMWMRLDGKKDMTGFDNMDDRPIKGTTDWKQYSIVLDIPDETVFIAFGTFVHGSGTAWVDDYSLEIVGDDTSTTNMLSGEPPEKTEEQNEQYEKHLKINYPDNPHNLECDERLIDILDMRDK
jgi:AraC family transcriptional regulator